MTTLSPMVRAYLGCALWTAIDDDGNPLDKRYSPEDFAPQAVAQATMDCDVFIRACLSAGDLLVDVDASQAGHDLWLTRNGHGAGFWDRGLGTVGDELSDLCRKMGESALYVGDDNLLHLSPEVAP